MYLLIIISFLVMALLLGRIWIWLVIAVMNPLNHKAETKEGNPDIENPYIAEHLTRRHNDRCYEEYFEWLDKDGGD